MTTNDNINIDPVLRVSQVQLAVSYSVSQIYRMIKAGTFPAPLRLGPGRVGWRHSVVENWLRQREIGA